ncbi:zinc finger protein 646-like [Hyla sarda]|uniref:zinc finger protein 646-like n=1 Tax=Hyla sarda TaxID=327740 RepID=UPI0024C23A5F|nr:zinc finger protein 646-like [Hyla sarda]XP_056390176.1 zinc finger protein 646-like [Hyla sarda]
MNMDDGNDQSYGSSNQNLNYDQSHMSFSHSTELESHQESHKEERPYKCNLCDKSYRHAGSLVNHKKTHQIGLYTCLICQKEYSNPMGLKSHLRIHSEEKRFKCEQCGEAFRMSQQLYNHRKSLHGYYSTTNGEKITRNSKFEVQSPVLVESSNLMSNLENYIAESMLPVDFPQIVSKYYPDEKAEDEDPTKEDVEGHETFKDEKDQTNDSNIEEYRYKCTQCGKAYKHAGSLANHRQSHMVGIYQCAVCYKEFSNLMAMKNHCRLHSDSRARRSCKSPRSSGRSSGVHRPEQQQFSEDRSDLPQIKVLQSMEKELDSPSLPELSKTIKSEDDDEAVLIPHTHQQDEHASSISPPTKPNNILTDNPFSSDSVVENIMEDEAKEKANDFLAEQPEYDDSHEDETKSGDRPYKCQECGKTYRHAGSLINHKKTHQTGVYSCSLCSKQMFNMAALKNHVRAHFKCKAGKRLGESYFSSLGLSDELYQNQEDSYQYGVGDKVSYNESDFLQHQLLHQKQEIQEMSNDKLVENVPEAGTWQETPQGGSDDSAYSSGPGFPDVKIEMDNLALQQWNQDDSLATPHKVKLENGDDDVQNAETTSFEQSCPEPVACQDPESTEMEEHQQVTDDRPHKCDLCGRTYRHKSSLINHKLTHKTGVYQCSLCPKQYSNLMALRNHVRFHSRSYAGRRGIASRRSRQFFRNKPRFLQNRNSHSLADTTKLSNEIPHETTTSNGGVERLDESQNCCTCGKSFDCSEHFQTHRMSCPSAITVSPANTLTNVQCEISISTSTEKDLSKVKEPVEPQEKVVESSENYGKRVYECDLCNKSYRHSGSLINHKRTHQTGDYMCPYCSKHVLNMAALKNHIRIHHKAKKGQQGELHVDHALLYSDVSYPPAGKGLYSCVSCEEMFQTESDLVAHQMLHISLEGNQWDYEGPRTSSPEMNKETLFRGIGDSDWDHSNNRDYQDDHKHLNSEDEEKPSEYTCVECGEVYDHLDDLTDHKRSHQAGIYQCSFCPKEYPNLLALRSHFETHTKPQTLRNTSLDGSEGKGFVDNTLLVDNHYDCGHCGLIFSNEGDFHQHQVAHEKQVIDESLPGLHSEEQVPEFFSMHSSEKELLSRIKSEIEETEHSEANDGGSLLSHICGFCGKTYDDLESLQVHSFSHSNEEASADENLHHETDLEENPQQHSSILKQGEGSGSTGKNEGSPESRPYTCKQCGKTYRHGGSLVNHKKTHLVGNFQCVACSRRYHNLAAYRTHFRHHPKCRQPAAFNNQHERLALQDSIYPSGDEKPLTFSISSSDPVPHGSDGQPDDFNKIEDFTSKEACLTSQYYSQMTKNKNSRRRFSRQIGRVRKVQTSKPTSLGSKSCALDISDVEVKKVQVCEFCGKTFGVKELALHLSGHCGGHSAKVSGTLIERKEEVQNIPILPDSALSQNERETGFYWRPFRCEVCGRSYRHAGSLINHKQTHKTGIFRCSICQKRFFNLMAMKNHNRIHFELKRHKCLDCGKAFRLRKQLDTHQRIHRQRTSARKLGRRNRKSRYRRFAQGRHQKSLMQVSSDGSSLDDKSSDCRVKKEKDPDARPYQCEECGRSYRHAGSLFNHKKSHKTGQYHCSICDKTYSNLMALKNHQRTHYEAKRHSCSQCGKTFKWKRQLLRHQLVHVQEGSQLDSQVPFRMEEVKIIDGHQQGNSTVAREASITNKEDISSGANMIIRDSSESTSQPQPVCVTCGISFTNYEELAHHACRRNSIDTLASEGTGTGESTQFEHKDDRPHRCDICNRTYRHASSLHTHKSTHKRGNYKCSICHKEFLNPISMKAHLRTHKVQKRFQCGDCGQTFRSSQQLISHKTVHTGDKPLLCTICNRGFSCQVTLRHHQRTHKPLSSPARSSSIVLPSQTPNSGKIASQSGEKFHKDQAGQGDRKYKCKQCSRSYLHAASLFNHQKTHNIGVYKCPNCFKVYSNLLAFKNHLRIHRYSCKECGKAFRNSTDLATHSKIHEEGSFTCSLCDKHFLCRSSLKRHQQIHSNQASDILDPQPVSHNFMVEVT